MNNAYFNGFQTSPQYYQSQFDNVMNQYKNIYNQTQIPNTQNGFVGQYVTTYEEVEKAQVSMSGIPTMFVADGVFWIKKFVNGQPYISAFKFEPINNVGEPKQQEQGVNTNSQLETILGGLESAINNINDRLSKLEGGNQ
jgi:hypothetical protein